MPELREIWGGVIARFTDAGAAQIERDREHGAAPPGADARSLSGVLIAMNERCFHYAVSAGDPADDAALVETLAGVWLAAVYGHGPSGGSGRGRQAKKKTSPSTA